MKVRVLHVPAFNLTSNSDLIQKIKREGTEVRGPWPYGSTVNVSDMFFILGGRNSIETVLSRVPGGKFRGSSLSVKVQTEAKLTKRYTIVCVFISNFGARFGTNKQAWGKNMFTIPTAEVTFQAITSKLWENEGKIVDGIVDYAGLG